MDCPLREGQAPLRCLTVGELGLHYAARACNSLVLSVFQFVTQLNPVPREALRAEEGLLWRAVP